MTEEVEVVNGESDQDPEIENEADQEVAVTKITDVAGCVKHPSYILHLLLSPVIYVLKQIRNILSLSIIFFHGSHHRSSRKGKGQ